MIEKDPREILFDAIQDFVNATDDEAPVLLRGAVVVVESMRMDEDGDSLYRFQYIIKEGTTPSETIGLLKIGMTDALDDLIG